MFSKVSLLSVQHGLRNWLFPHELFALILGQSEAVVAVFDWPAMTSDPCLTVHAFSSCKSIYFRYFHYYALSLCTPRNNTSFSALKDNENFCFKFWTPWPNLDWFGVSCLVLGAAVHQVFNTKPSGMPWLLFSVSHGDLRSRRMQNCGDQSDFPVQKHLPFWCEKALYATNGVPVLGEAGWELMQILLSQFLVYPFLKALAALHMQNCPHKDRKLSNRGIALLLRANVTAILNYNFKT